VQSKAACFGIFNNIARLALTDCDGNGPAVPSETVVSGSVWFAPIAALVLALCPLDVIPAVITGVVSPRVAVSVEVTVKPADLAVEVGIRLEEEVKLDPVVTATVAPIEEKETTVSLASNHVRITH